MHAHSNYSFDVHASPMPCIRRLRINMQLATRPYLFEVFFDSTLEVGLA